MSPRTYIGPFGRILPLPDDEEPDPHHLPYNAIDETRHPAAMYKLPPPERLHFGSDKSSGFTEPIRYNTISQSNRTHGSTPSHVGEPSARPGQLPSLHHLLTPSTQSNASAPTPTTYSPQRTSKPSHRPPTSFPHNHQPSADQIPSQYPHQSTYPQPQVQPSIPRSSPRENYQISPAIQDFPAFPSRQQGLITPSHHPSYVSNQQTQYSSQFSHAGQPIPAGQQSFSSSNVAQSMHPLGAAQPQQMQPFSSPAVFYEGQTGTYQLVMNSAMPSDRSQSTPLNNVKPQPRVVAERDVPGEGPSWVYEDGTTCKKIIDGEEVNAQWGITKAGKPRKRLAIACTTCREKKIKCDPAEPKCVQCEKFGRECRFMTAFRNQRGSPDSSSYDSQARTSHINIKVETPSEQTPRSPCLGGRKALKRQKSSPETLSAKVEIRKLPGKAIPSSRQRSSLPGHLLPNFKSDPPKCGTSPGIASPIWDKCLPKASLPSYDWCNDPFDIDAKTSLHYAEKYFEHINGGTYRLFPKRPFLRWAQCSQSKSPEELMTLYALLAVGTIFSSRPEHESEGEFFCNVAKYAAERCQGNFGLQLIHCRLLMTLYYFSVGEQQVSWDYGGMAIRAASGLKLNLESECQHIQAHEEFQYGLNRHSLAECRRRAFWSAYLTDRFSGFCSGHLCMLQSQDTYLRLPCEETQYEEQECLNTPYFDNGIIDKRLCETTKGSNLGLMAFSVQISSIWSEVLAHVFRSSQLASTHYLDDFQSFSNFANEKLALWERDLPSHLSCTKPGATHCISNGDVSSFVSLHAIYHTALITLNRKVRHALLPVSTLARCVNKAIDHARRLLQMVQMIEAAGHDVQYSLSTNKAPSPSVDLAFSTPFIGYAILSAVDVLSAGGLLKSYASTVALVESNLAIFDRLNRFWATARSQSKAIRGRLDRLMECVNSKAAADKSAWKCTHPLDPGFGTDQDVFYDDHDQRGVNLLDHCGITIPEDEILLVD